ncbi:MAG: hypothetical protein PHS96_13185 [Anaerolineales bacterium]|nr:hypothetical protein [Anaerolineales bacterium]
MDAIRERLNQPIIAGVVGLVLGLILGWFVIGWGLWPVEWSDAAPQHLRQDLQEDYMRMAIDSYARNKDLALAKSRYEALGEGASQVLQNVEMNPQFQDLASITTFRTAIQAGAAPVAGVTPGALTPAVLTPAVSTPGVPTPTPTKQPFGATFVRVIFPILCIVVLLVGGGLVLLYILRNRKGGGARTSTPMAQAQQAPRQAEWTDYDSIGEEPPMVQFMASYKLGDDLFDDSFSIDSPAGEFLGECGVGISETIGVGDPKKVTAFEVWLFDKNDIQTVTKVLMSEHAINDESIRQRLAAKGEPIQAMPGTETVLETQTLRLMARVVDMAYGDGPLPAKSIFERMILELAVWMKA